MSKVLENFHARLNAQIRIHSQSQVLLVDEITDYLLSTDGKRVRAKLIWLLGSLSNQVDEKKLLDLCCAIEFIHLATLIHDDVIDQSLLRRGKACVHAKWGTSEAVLVGDFLYSRAFEILVSLGDIRILALCSKTTNQLAQGEIEQLTLSQNPRLTRQQYFQVIDKKTAALFVCACGCAAFLGAYNQMYIDTFCQIGKDIGLAFQLIDDVLDYQIHTHDMGKQPGNDFYTGKYTLPLIEVLSLAEEHQKTHIQTLLQSPNTSSFLQVVEIMESLGIFPKIQQEISIYLNRAKNTLIDLCATIHGNEQYVQTIQTILLHEIASLYQRAVIKPTEEKKQSKNYAKQ